MKRPARRAFVTTMAVFMIALVAVALAALTSEVGTAARQANAQRERAQAEQLLIAGIEIARQAQLTGDRTIKLPSSLVEEVAGLKINLQGKRLHVEATVGRTKLREPE
jgi:type II secretory pathway component PulK